MRWWARAGWCVWAVDSGLTIRDRDAASDPLRPLRPFQSQIRSQKPMPKHNLGGSVLGVTRRFQSISTSFVQNMHLTNRSNVVQLLNDRTDWFQDAHTPILYPTKHTPRQAGKARAMGAAVSRSRARSKTGSFWSRKKSAVTSLSSPATYKWCVNRRPRHSTCSPRSPCFPPFPNTQRLRRRGGRRRHRAQEQHPDARGPAAPRGGVRRDPGLAGLGVPQGI